MIKLNSTTELYIRFKQDLFDFIHTHELGEFGEMEGSPITVNLPKLDFNRLVKAQFDLTQQTFDVIINDGKIRYGYVTCFEIENYGDRVIEIFLQKLRKREKYIETVIDKFPSIVYNTEEDQICGELKEELLKLKF